MSDNSKSLEQGLETELAENPVGRREVDNSLPGTLGAAALAGCGPEFEGAPLPEELNARALQQASLVGSSVRWVSTVLGVPSADGTTPRPGDLSTLVSTSPGEIVIAHGCVTPGDGGGGVFYWSDAVTDDADDGGTYIVPKADGTGTTGATGAGWRRIYSGPLSVQWFGAVGNGVANDTKAIQATLSAAANTHDSVFFPAGRYLLESTAFSTYDNATPVRGAGTHRTVLQSHNIASGTVIDITPSEYGNSIVLEDFAVLGNGSTGHGIHIRGKPSGVQLRRLYISGCGEKGIYAPSIWHSTLEDVEVTYCKDNSFELGFLTTSTMLRCYARIVAAGKAGFRILTGSPAMIACNTMDVPSDENWSNVGAMGGLFGQDPASDGVLGYVRPTLINCNFESIPDQGVGLKFRAGSWANLFACSFMAGTTGTCKAMDFVFVDNYGGVVDAACTINTYGAAWANNHPIHHHFSRSPIKLSMNGAFSKFWDLADSVSCTIPTLSNTYAAAFFNALTFNSVKVAGPLLQTRTQVTLAATLAIDLRLGNQFTISIGDAIGRGVGAPFGGVDGMAFTVTVRNVGAGAMGGLTWDAAYKMAAWTNPAAGFSRSISFAWDGSHWVEVSRTPADVPN